jgi:hypothetical protein
MSRVRTGPVEFRVLGEGRQSGALVAGEAKSFGRKARLRLGRAPLSDPQVWAAIPRDEKKVSGLPGPGKSG